uniref:Zinc transporter ZIP1 n=1 Tax=Syphacia muris TaxID=451379 RepID=A0A0N5AIQ4_9BILA
MESYLSAAISRNEVHSTYPVHDALKAVFIVTLFITSFLASIFPFVIRQWASHGNTGHARVFSLLSVLGGGVFLSTCLLDLLPDAIKSVRLAEQHGHFKTALPIAEFIVAVGFAFVLSVEQVTLYLKERNYIGSDVLERLISHEEILPDPTHPHTQDDENTANVDLHFNPSSHSTMRAALLVMALSLHAVFEGLSLGVIQDANSLLQVFLALILHKSIIAFSLGLRLVQSKMRVFTVVVCCIIFTSQVLIGGFGGIAILDLISAGTPYKAALISGCFQAFACGTFLYITCFEILPHELSQQGFRLLKLGCLAIGFTIITVMLVIFPDDD